MSIIGKGAEATLTRVGDVLIKERVAKAYRLRELDVVLRVRRTRAEARLLTEARRVGVLVPAVREAHGTTLTLDFIEGDRVKDILNEENAQPFAAAVARNVALLHGAGIIHGDLTTSNMIANERGVWFIDFGLGFRSTRREDKAVDLYLLRQVVNATHSRIVAVFWPAFLQEYDRCATGGREVIKALLSIERRGRYRRRS